jgi:mono/diheme cytochrome c family protein
LNQLHEREIAFHYSKTGFKKPCAKGQSEIMMNTTKNLYVYRRPLPFATQLVSIVLQSAFAWTQARNGGQKSKGKGTEPNAVARGKYIVEGVAMCTQCHTPRTNSGALDTPHWLQGAPLWLNPAKPVSGWPLKAPRLAGLIAGSDDDLIKLLTTGTWRNGQALRPPMPQFRMTRQDAAAVVAYLKSLPMSPEQ